MHPIPSRPPAADTARPVAPVPTADPHARSPATRQWTSDQLLGAAGVATITHGGMAYRLSRTAQGKLILTK